MFKRPTGRSFVTVLLLSCLSHRTLHPGQRFDTVFVPKKMKKKFYSSSSSNFWQWADLRGQNTYKHNLCLTLSLSHTHTHTHTHTLVSRWWHFVWQSSSHGVLPGQWECVCVCVCLGRLYVCVCWPVIVGLQIMCVFTSPVIFKETIHPFFLLCATSLTAEDKDKCLQQSC